MTSFLAHLSARTRICSLNAVVSFLFATSAAAQAEDPRSPAADNHNVGSDVSSDVEIEVDSDVSPPAENPPAEPASGDRADVVTDPQDVASPAEQGAQVTSQDRPLGEVQSPKVEVSAPEELAAGEKEALQVTPQKSEPVLGERSLFGTSLPRGASLVSASLEAEGTNYRRPLRLGFLMWGFVQAQYTANQISEDQLDADGVPLNRNEFEVPRARLRLDHGWKYAFATLELEAGTTNGPPVRMRRAEASLLYRGNATDDVTPPIVLTGGITDIPFGAELGESQRDRLFMERSLPSLAIFPSNADLGAKLWGAYGPIDYAVALVNGEPLAENGWPKDLNAAKDVTGRLGALSQLGKKGQIKGGVSFYVGKGVSPGTPGTKGTLQWVDLNSNGAVDAGEIQGLTGSSAIPSQNFSRFATGLDVGTTWLLPVGPLQVGAEVFVASNMDRGLLPNDPTLTGANSRQFGASFFFVQGVTRWVGLGFRGAYYDPNSNIVEQRSGTFHLKNQTIWELAPSLALLLDRARISAEYDFIIDHLGRDSTGVPSNVANNRWTVRLQVDL